MLHEDFGFPRTTTKASNDLKSKGIFKRNVSKKLFPLTFEKSVQNILVMRGKFSTLYSLNSNSATTG